MAMIATIVNAAAVVVGSLIGVFFNTRIKDDFKHVVYNAIGVVSLIIGISMTLKATKIIYLALSLVIGGVIGNWWNVEGGILKLGEFLRRRFSRGNHEHDFAFAFLTASVLFCVGAMTIVGAFQAGTEGNYELLFTKSVMDGFMSIMLSAAMGIGVAFSFLTILIYQGGLTLLAGLIAPLVTPLVISELNGVGGALVIMIGINLLELKTIKTANFVPSLLVILLFVAVDPLFGGIHF
ncbi:MAG TPA: DUF554 domain-containing protein [Spirochaetia bacterium]|nr:DUF554 domain-containing protein [Spirochaetia bacterium]